MHCVTNEAHGVITGQPVRQEMTRSDLVSPALSHMCSGGLTGRTRRPYRVRMRIEGMTAAHAAQVLAVYQQGMDEGEATFETLAPSWDEFDAAKLPGHRFVALEQTTLDLDTGPDGPEGPGRPGRPGVVLGWIAGSPVSARAAYAGVVEHSVYVRPESRGCGVARALLTAFLASTEASGIWTVQGGVFPENTASVALHRSAGFREIGVRERVGRLNGVWRDVLLLERRSRVAGV